VAYRILGDAVMLIHFAFLVFLALGGFLACRFRWVIVPHLAAAVWAAMSVFVGVECPLTRWEDGLRQLSGRPRLPGGFVDTYLTGVIYPGQHLRAVQLLLAVVVALSWVRFAIGYRHTSSDTRPRASSGPRPRSRSSHETEGGSA
jgi:uncharacterized protein DUF2784